jgi:hypothetical protein
MMDMIPAVYTEILPIEKKAIFDCLDKLSDVPLTYVEIGVLFGGTFRKVLDHLKNKKVDNYKCIAVDLFEDFVCKDDNTHGGDSCQREKLQDALEALGHTNFSLLKGDSQTVIPTIDKFDNGVVFIDANHTYKACLADFEAINEKICSGFILFHDCQMRHHWPDGGPDRVVDEIIKKCENLSLVEYYGSVAVIAKRQ